MLKTTTRTKYLQFTLIYNIVTENDFSSNIKSEESLKFFFSQKPEEDRRQQGHWAGLYTICMGAICQ